MIPALATAVFFALSAIFARRSTLLVGSQRANLARLLLALFLVGIWAHTWGLGLHGAGFWILLLSGVIGFGLGDWALFEAYPRIGSALTILLCQCLAAPIAAVTEWAFLGTTMTLAEIGSSVLILVGVGLAMAPEHESDIPAGHRVAGILYGLVAAAGQAWGAVLSRVAYSRDQANGVLLDGMTAAYQRLWGGVLFLGVLLLVRHLIQSRRTPAVGPVTFRPDWKSGWPWVAGNALAGAVFGVSCFQWALLSNPSAVVLPIVATTPLVVMAISFVFEGIRPGKKAIVGAVLAVTGVVVLVRLSADS